MAPPATEKKKRRNRRKARTEVSSSSSSSESERSTSPSPSLDDTPAEASVTAKTKPTADEEKPTVVKRRVVDSNEAFSDFYLRQTTKEFSEDLDKLRGANDFNAKSVPILIEALKQGTACFSKDEAAKVGQASNATS